MSTHGRVVWHDLMSTDPATSEKFFTQLFGWQVNEVEMGPAGAYHMLSSGGTEIGGVVPLDKSHGMPSHWISYVEVDDVDAACERTRECGGEVPVAPTDIPNVGRFAVIRDPTGGHISPVRSAHGQPPEPDAPTPAGQFIWEELLTTDVDRAKAFYGEVFGWDSREMDMGAMGTYTVFSSGGKDRGGTMKMPPEAEAPPHWLSYVAVEDVDATAARIQGLGGKLYVEPSDIPNVGRFAVAADPTGAAFAIYQTARQS